MSDDEQSPSDSDSSKENSELEDTELSQEEGNPTQTTQYSISAEVDSGHMTSVVGDNPHVNIYYYIQMVEGKRKWPLGNSSDGEELDDSSSSTDVLIKGNLEFERQSTTSFDNDRSETGDGNTQSPETEEEISEWYYNLGDYEQCYVQAAAVLHGAPAHEVSKRADKLYKLSYEQMKQHETYLSSAPQQEDQKENQQRDLPRFFDISPHRRPSIELRARTHTVTRRVNGIERLFWQDVDLHGLSIFGLRFLAFLANEFINRGEHGESFLNELRKWSEERSGECAWRSAWAYGAVLWCQNVDELRRKAEDWARTRSLLDRRRAASLLDGAYEMDRTTNWEQSKNTKTSLVLQLLDVWVTHTHTQINVSNTNLGCAAASTYGLIGKKSPEIALKGIEQLLQLPERQSTDDTRRIFAAGVSAYVSLTWSGHVRCILEHLASSAEQLSHQRRLPIKLNERQKYRRQREVRLNAIFETFFLVAATSLSEADNTSLAFYSITKQLPQQSAFPDQYRRDILLAGLLVKDEVRWRENIKTLICAAIIEKRSRTVFGLMEQWAEIVLKIQEMQSSEAEQKYTAFKQFMVDLGKMVNEWCNDLKKQLGHTPQAADVYKNRLERWYKKNHLHTYSMGSLAQDILNQL